MMTSVLGVLFDGFAYGMLLFLLSVGLSVTLGMMNFVNLAHCTFAAVGGYCTVTVVNRLGWPFLAALPMAFLAGALASVVLERLLFRRLYWASDLDQCLVTIGIAFMSIATFAWFYTTEPQSTLPLAWYDSTRWSRLTRLTWRRWSRSSSSTSDGSASWTTWTWCPA